MNRNEKIGHIYEIEEKTEIKERIGHIFELNEKNGSKDKTENKK